MKKFIVALAALLCGTPGYAGNSNSLMDISADGSLLACSNRDSGTVTIVALAGAETRKLREIPVGQKPAGVTFVGSSHTVAVAVYADDRVTLLDADQGQVVGTVDVFDEPYGIVSNRDGSRLYVTLDYPGRVVELDPREAKVLREMPVSSFNRGIALDESAGRLYVTEFYTSAVHALDVGSGKLVDYWKGASTDNLCRQITLHPKRPKAYLPHIRSRVTAVHGEGSIFPYLTVMDSAPGEGRRRKRIPMDAFLGNLVTANPWEVAVSPDGQRLYIVFSGTDDVFACNVLDDNYREVERRSYQRIGRNPRAVRVGPDGTVYIYHALDFELVAYHPDSWQALARVEVTENPLGEQVWQGKVLFYSALQPMVGRRWISCSSCHPDGEPDGRTWHNPEGLRNTQSLAGMAWTHPLHWSADRDEVQDFEHTIRGPLMQGRGLISGPAFDSLAEPNRKRSELADALAAYSNSHKFTLSPYAKQGLSEAAQRGKQLFFSDETGCARCHRGPLFTDSVPLASSKLIRHDVGTGDDDPTEKMGPAYDTPSLLGVYRTAPYLHHGRAATLAEVLTTYNPADRHGKTSHLSAAQIQDLVEYLKMLPYEAVDKAARDAGLRQVND